VVERLLDDGLLPRPHILLDQEESLPEAQLVVLVEIELSELFGGKQEFLDVLCIIEDDHWEVAEIGVVGLEVRGLLHHLFHVMQGIPILLEVLLLYSKQPEDGFCQYLEVRVHLLEVSGSQGDFDEELINEVEDEACRYY
jgi:hypothetical protein